MGRTSPFAAPSIDEAYAAYCSMVVPMHKARAEKEGKIFRKPTKAAWIKKNRRRYDEHQQAMTAEPLPDLMGALRESLAANGGVEAFEGTPTPATNGGMTLETFVQSLVTAGISGKALVDAITAFQSNGGSTPTPAPTFRKRHTKDEQHKDAARNGLLWALNDEGLLTEALEASPGDYVTQEAGIAIMQRTFGSLDRA